MLDWFGIALRRYGNCGRLSPKQQQGNHFRELDDFFKSWVLTKHEGVTEQLPVNKYLLTDTSGFSIDYSKVITQNFEQTIKQFKRNKPYLQLNLQ